jgi:cellulose synthase (UDP-forming)
VNSFSETQSGATRAWRLIVTCVGLFLLFQFVSLYLSWPKQIVLGSVSIGLVILLNRSSKSRVVTLALMLISLAATLRYGWWRIHMIFDFFSDESNHRVTIDAVLMLVLLSAEAYTILIMVLGFMQTSAPLRRKPIPLPADENEWPHVDVLIPTYNEPLSLVRYTALAAINMDYPPEKLHVSILDDGTREDFRLFCEEANVGYVVRAKHDHAKAGNINHALEEMDSPLVTIFDCDHVPTRSFLQVTVGWFLADERLAMLQTPHFFYSPDPFERNLLQYKTIPNEGELFYGVIQDGNDLWNATFFCGSCAVIRRTALDEVGGIATETVTEDAHTSLRMQKAGWGTAYINLPQAAGLATETLSAHVGQRVRWARGMIQILRTDNPLLAKGMKVTQRLCYFNAMLHFMYAVPRLIFLLAPLVYMLGGRTIIPGYWVAILAYAMPHLVISSLTNSRVQGMHRHSFWNEIYETVLAPYILLPTLLALINPKLGKFNVTDKGSTLAETRFDSHIAAPTTWLLALNFLGVCMAPYRLLVKDPTHPGTVISNLVWILFNMVILGVAAAVANEQKQRRTSVRIPARIQMMLQTEDGTTYTGMTTDMSVGGASVGLPVGVTIPNMTRLGVAFPMQTGKAAIGAQAVGQYGQSLRVKFAAYTIEEQETLTRALYSRADSWITSRGDIEEDRPLVSLARVVRLSFTGFYEVIRGLIPGKASAAVGVLLAVLLGGVAAGQIPGAMPAAAVVAPANAQDALAAASAAAGLVVQDVPPAPVVPAMTEADASYKITLKDMGVVSSVAMRGPHNFYSEGFVLPNSQIPRKAQLNLTYHFSSGVLPRTGSIKVSVNNTPVGEIDAPEQPMRVGEYGYASFPVSPDVLIRNNSLTFEFRGGTALSREDSVQSAVLGNVGASSTLLIAAEKIPARKDLSVLPLPLFDADLQTSTTIPFCFMTEPSMKTMQAAGVVASWFGVLQSAAPIHFSASVGQIPKGDVVLLVSRMADVPAGLQVPAGGGSISLLTNPSDPDGTVLVLAGEDDDHLLAVAQSLALMTVQHPQVGVTIPALGSSVRIGDFAMPAERKPDDAPRWLMTDRLKSLWTERSQAAYRTNGSAPLPIYFRPPPDLYFGENQNLNLRLNYRYNALAVADGSAMRVYINGNLVNEAQLPPGKDYVDRTRAILLPTEMMRPFGNTLLVSFDFVPGKAGQALEGDVLRTSALDIRGLAHWAAMPNLELFANAGFPFTRLADLGSTTVVMPAVPSAQEITLLLYMMSHFGTQTGYPALRVEVSGPDAVMRDGRDYLVLGGINDQPAFGQLEDALPVSLDANGVHVRAIASRFSALTEWWKRLLGEPTERDLPGNAGGVPDVMLEGVQAPDYPGRSIVVVALRTDGAVEEFADEFLKRSQSSDISETVSLLRGGKFQSYAVPVPTYHVGYVSSYTLMRIWLAQYFWVLLVVVSVLCLVVARWIQEFLVWLAASRLAPAEKVL